MKLQPLIIFVRQYWLFLIVFQLAVVFIIPRAAAGQYLFTFLFIKSIEYAALLVQVKSYQREKQSLYLNLGINLNHLILVTCAIDSFLSIVLILAIT